MRNDKLKKSYMNILLDFEILKTMSDNSDHSALIVYMGYAIGKSKAFEHPLFGCFTHLLLTGA